MCSFFVPGTPSRTGPSNEMESPYTQVVFVGGGHSNVQVMVKLAAELKKQDKCQVTLISDYPFAYYSGMLPGCVANLYTVDEISMDLVALCGWCKINWIQGKMIGKNRTVSF